VIWKLLIAAAVFSAGVVVGVLALPDPARDELQTCALAVHDAYENVESGERYFGVCIRELETATKLETSCERKLSRCQGVR
jgi:N-acetylglutamate synthase-like GNAT family acetyltransferase